VSLGVTTKSQEAVSRLQADSPSTRAFIRFSPSQDTTGKHSVEVVRVPGEKVSAPWSFEWPQGQGGIGETKAEPERFVAELALGTPTERPTVT
jgi:hypothetical protein